jgi:hypothetical protein
MISSLNYMGPIGLGTDDTMIERSLQAYLANDGSWLVVGGCGRPILARPPPSHTSTAESNDCADLGPDILNILRDRAIERADKVRVILLIIPVAKVSARL